MATEETEAIEAMHEPCWPETLCFRDTGQPCITEAGHPCEFTK